MKHSSRNLLIAVAIIVVPFVTFADKEGTSKPEYNLPVYKVEDVTLPVPSKIVVPRLGGMHVGSQVRMNFEITTDGIARNIHQEGISFDQRTNDLAATMELILRNWEFEPVSIASVGTMTGRLW